MGKAGYRIFCEVPIDPCDPDEFIFELIYYEPASINNITGNKLPPKITKLGLLAGESKDNLKIKLDALQKALNEALQYPVIEEETQFIKK